MRLRFLIALLVLTASLAWATYDPAWVGNRTFVINYSTGATAAMPSGGLAWGPLRRTDTGSSFPDFRRAILVPAGTVIRIYCQADTAPGGAVTRLFYVAKNSSATQLGTGCSFTGAATSCDQAENVSFSSGDWLSLIAQNSGGSPAGSTGRCAVVYRAS